MPPVAALARGAWFTLLMTAAVVVVQATSITRRFITDEKSEPGSAIVTPVDEKNPVFVGWVVMHVMRLFAKLSASLPSSRRVSVMFFSGPPPTQPGSTLGLMEASRDEIGTPQLRQIFFPLTELVCRTSVQVTITRSLAKLVNAPSMVPSLSTSAHSTMPKTNR